ncbi:unnamed protein product [Choristocarpus tenellus]|uniref:50S ribosomal protein L19 n=1 Tax=Choristocarpus tenellus TaxID=116065 RepID=UPI002E7668C1|nr:50S ribosomal protein L19 [Choristocarpus tenellus]WAM62378.1 50S ribosomal protein L19 [Choristocarpus tenellus]
MTNNNLVIKINSTQIINSIEKPYIKKDIPKILVGDNVKIGVLIREGNKERIQYFQGLVICQRNSGINKTIMVRKVIQGIGVERIFLLNSPKLESITIQKSSQIRRSKLYYLRYLAGKASRLKQKFS